MSHIVKLDGLIDQCVSVLVGKLGKMADWNQECNLIKWLKLLSLDVITRATFGADFEALTYYASVAGIYLEWHRWLWKFFPASWPREKAARDFSQKQIKKKEAAISNNKTPYLLDVWLRQKNANKISREDIRMGISTNLGAIEVSPSFMCAIIYEVYRQPTILKRLREEVDAVIAQGNPGNYRIASHEMIQAMPYFQASIKETMRLYPAPNIIFPRMVPEGGANLAEYHFRTRQTVGVNF
jgi:cytochrome P450